MRESIVIDQQNAYQTGSGEGQTMMIGRESALAYRFPGMMELPPIASAATHATPTATITRRTHTCAILPRVL